jgi:hypothetical protein
VANECLTIPCDSTWRISLWVFLVILRDEWVSESFLCSYATNKSLNLSRDRKRLIPCELTWQMSVCLFLVILCDELISESFLWPYVMNEYLTLPCDTAFRKIIRCICVSYSGGYEAFYLLWYKAVQSVENKQTFRSNTLPFPSGSTSKLRKASNKAGSNATNRIELSSL